VFKNCSVSPKPAQTPEPLTGWALKPSRRGGFWLFNNLSLYRVFEHRILGGQQCSKTVFEQFLNISIDLVE
jgi:hypothetical protein